MRHQVDFDVVCQELKRRPRRWLITGVAGFIGSNLLEALLLLDQTVVGLDNFSTGKRCNLDMVLTEVSTTQAGRFRLVEADICQLQSCHSACDRVDIVLHQAALGSVPRSISDPLATHATNLDGFLNMLTAARDARAERFVYASSSSVYGDHPQLPKVEGVEGMPLSPYAVTKRANELYALVFGGTYGMNTVGLRYFNVFGRRQNPDGPYAAVIPRWFRSMLGGEPVQIFGDGETSRDFCYVDNVVQANILAGCSTNSAAMNQVYNVAYGGRTTLNTLFQMIRERVASFSPSLDISSPVYLNQRAGDVRHSLADISKASSLLGYNPVYSVGQGLDRAAEWYCQHMARAR